MIIAPGATLGILGGGQLGRMAALAAARHGYMVHIYTAQQDSPAAKVAARATLAAWDDWEALARFAQDVQVVTLEFEDVPAPTAQWLSQRVPVYPSPRALAITQDRAQEKAFVRACGVPTAPYHVVQDAHQAAQALQALGGQGILKRARFGYDGKGQVRLTPGADVEDAWRLMGGELGVLEGVIDFERELSVVLARGLQGQLALYPVVENEHRDHILRKTIAPARIEPALVQRAHQMAQTLADALDYVGVMAVEFFLTRQGQLLVNEIAPRPHNSGHWTMDAAMTDQFEQQIRAVCGLPLGDPSLRDEAVMENLIGQDVARWPELLAQPGARLHLYGKDEPRPGRKMGHVNWLGDAARPRR